MASIQDIESEIAERMRRQSKERKEVIEEMLEGAIKGAGGAEAEIEMFFRARAEADRKIPAAEGRLRQEKERIATLKEIRKKEDTADE